jgi:hypothetical protein
MAVVISCEAKPRQVQSTPKESVHRVEPDSKRDVAPFEKKPAGPPPEIVWADAPFEPARLRPASRPQIVLLSAPWCQWCRVFEHEVLPDADVRRSLAAYGTSHVDVDAAPTWMDLDGFEGLPALTFFDQEGRHVLTRSGFLPAAELTTLLDAIRQRLAAGELEPYETKTSVLRLSQAALTPQAAKVELDRLESAIYMKVNSNDGGFHTPARHPYPALLLELERWREAGAPDRVADWVELTMKGALRGGSPRLRGEPLADMDYAAQELSQLSQKGPDAGPRWREGIERLPDVDPFLGLQDPIDGGLFRYAAGPGWYHPHFERRAMENLAWAELLSRTKQHERAQRVLAFVEETFDQGGLLGTSQRADPFFYRLNERERAEVSSPPVAAQWNLDVQARAARLLPKRCSLLLRVPGDQWPRASWSMDGEEPDSGAAPPDVVGELLLALHACRGGDYDKRARELADVVLQRWEHEGVRAHARAFRLAAGVCAVRPEACARVLAAVQGLAVELSHPPPLFELARLAGRASKPDGGP